MHQETSDEKYEAVVKNHPYFIYDTYTEQEVIAGNYVAAGPKRELEQFIRDYLNNDFTRYDIRRNG